MEKLERLKSLSAELKLSSISDNDRLAIFVTAKQILNDIDKDNQFSKHMTLFKGHMTITDPSSISNCKIIERAIDYFGSKD